MFVKDGREASGLGAALSQYSTTASNAPESVDAPIQRRSSGGNLLLSSQNRRSSFNTDRRRAATPMLNARFQFPERPAASPKLFSSTLLDSHEQLRALNLGLCIWHCT